MFHRGYKQNNSWCYTNLRPIPSNQEYDGHDDTGNRENNPSDQEKLKYEYPDRDTASSLILQDIFNMGDVRHREKLKIYRESLNLKCRG